MNVLSLFDGMSCGRIALERAGIKVDKYFASEIDKYAIKVTQHNWDDVTAIGDVTKISFSNGILYTEVGEFQVGKIDLVLAGSPCQGFSTEGKQLAFDDERSKLYFEFERILKEIQAENPNVKFLLENVRMKQEYKDIISERLGVAPVAINSNLVSAQNRYRLYWTNIGEITQPQDKHLYLKDVLDDNSSNYKYWSEDQVRKLENKEYVRKDYYRFEQMNKKVQCLMAQSGMSKPKVRHGGRIRYLTPIEFERLQTVPDNYTNCVSDAQRYKMLGNGWTVDVIVHILKHMKV